MNWLIFRIDCTRRQEMTPKAWTKNQIKGMWAQEVWTVVTGRVDHSWLRDWGAKCVNFTMSWVQGALAGRHRSGRGAHSRPAPWPRKPWTRQWCTDSRRFTFCPSRTSHFGYTLKSAMHSRIQKQTNHRQCTGNETILSNINKLSVTSEFEAICKKT